MRPDAPLDLPFPAIGAPPVPRLPRPLRWTMENGLRVVMLPRAGIPQIVLRLVLPAGAASDPAEYPGAASLLGDLLTEGTAALDADALNARLDGLGAALDVHVGHDFAEVEATLLAETLAEGVALMADVVRRPALPDDQLERVRAETLDALRGRLDEPANVADDRMALEVFGPDHPYGRPAFGTEAGIAAVPREALRALHAARYRPGGAFLVAAGAFDPEALRARLAEAFGTWAGSAAPVAYPAEPPVPARAGKLVRAAWPEAYQSEIRVAGGGLDRRAPEWVAGQVANYVLGGSVILGRLGANLREEKGWTYGARSGFTAGLAPGGWAAETAVDVEVTEEALAEIAAELTRMVEEPVPDDELARAKDALALSLPRAFETPAALASRFATLEAYGLPDDYWERLPARMAAVTPEEVTAIARRCFDPARVVRVVVGGDQ